VATEATVPFFFDRARLRALAEERAAAYQAADPFPHGVFDDFLPEAVARACLTEFETVATERLDLYTDSGNTRKLATSDEELMGPLTRNLIAEFNGKAMIDFLETLTGITGLTPDPHLMGGGLHQLDPGGFLKVHADFNIHPRLKLDRRINVLLYLNPDWREEWGGGLELWKEDMSARAQHVVPLLNRMVVFNTTSTSYHGNPEPVACPEGMARRSLAFYYYTNGRPEEERATAHTTLYQTPGATPPAAGAGPRKQPALRRIARDLLPPALVRAARRARRR